MDPPPSESPSSSRPSPLATAAAWTTLLLGMATTHLGLMVLCTPPVEMVVPAIALNGLGVALAFRRDLGRATRLALGLLCGLHLVLALLVGAPALIALFDSSDCAGDDPTRPLAPAPMPAAPPN